MKSQLKSVAMTAAGVILAGFIMYQFKNVPGVREARRAFDGNTR